MIRFILAMVCLMQAAVVFTPVSAGYLYCTSDSHVEPTLNEIMSNIVNVQDILGSSEEKMAENEEQSLGQIHRQLLDASKHSVKVVGSLPVPIRSLFANGLYTIDLTNTHADISFNDVYLIQQNYVSIGLICTSSLVPQLVKDMLCVCLEGDEINNSRLTNRERRLIMKALSNSSGDADQATGSAIQSPSHWCVSSSPVCTSRNMHDFCRVFVDPIRPSCIYIRHETNILQTLVDPLDIGGADGLRPSHQPLHKLVEFNLSSYTVGEYIDKWVTQTLGWQLKMPFGYAEIDPSVSDLTSSQSKASPATKKRGRSHRERQNTNVIDTERMRSQANALGKSSLRALKLVTDVIGKVPLYVCSAALGFSLIYLSEELSSNSLFQYSLTAAFGVLLFVCIFGYAAYSTTLSVSRRANIPLISSVLAPFVGWFALAPLAYSAFRNMVYYALLNFWNHGWFGVPWLGKVTFVGSAVISVLLARFFRLFRRREVYVTVENGIREQEIELEIPYGEKLLYYALRVVGMILLARSTSNIEISLVVLLLAMNMETIRYYISAWKMRSYATEPQVQNAVEVDHIVADTTARELEKLRNYIANHRGEINAKFGSNVHKHSLLNRFADGDYLGIPYSDSRMLYPGNKSRKPDNGSKSNIFAALFRFTVIAVVLVAVVVFNCLVVSDLN